MLIFFISLIAVYYPLKFQGQAKHHRFLERGDAFASGIFLGAALFHLLPDARENFISLFAGVHYPFAEVISAFGFLFLLSLERISKQSTLPIVVATIIIIHSFIEGSALGLNIALAPAIILAVAIIAHKGSESFALAFVLNRETLPKNILYLLVSVFLITTPLGIALGTFSTYFLQSHLEILLTAIFNAFAAGTFLYMSTLHHINHHAHGHKEEKLGEFFYLVAGLTLMAAVAMW
jgi:zinc transporter 1/2/3